MILPIKEVLTSELFTETPIQIIFAMVSGSGAIIAISFSMEASRIREFLAKKYIEKQELMITSIM